MKQSRYATDLNSQLDQHNATVMRAMRTIGLLCLGGGCFFAVNSLAMNSVAKAQTSRSVIFGEPLAAPNVPQAGIVPNYTPAPGLGATMRPTEGYLVYINGDSDLLLAQVRRVEPLAFRRPWNGQAVIQTGFFTSRDNAENRLAELRAQGFDAQTVVTTTQVAANTGGSTIASYNPSFGSQPATNTNYTQTTVGLTVPAIPNSTANLGGQTVTVYPNTGIGQAGSSGGAGPQLTFTAPPSTAAAETNRYPGYYVVVPGSRDGLPELAAKIQRLGADPANLFQRQQPRGPHIAMGPFPDRAAAEQWNKYLREFGMDARLYFER